MKTKQIPAIVMLLAGFILCIIAFMEQMKWGEFLKLLLIVLIVFYMIGCIGKAVLDPFFKEPEKIEENRESDDSDEAENTTEEDKDSIAGEDEE